MQDVFEEITVVVQCFEPRISLGCFKPRWFRARSYTGAVGVEAIRG